MTCSQCGRTVSFWQRDLATTLCGQCREIVKLAQQLEQTNLGESEWIRAIHDYAAYLTKCGKSRSEVEAMLVKARQDPRIAEVVAHVAELREHGTPGSEMAAQLVQRGIDAQVATNVANDVRDLPRQKMRQLQLNRQGVVGIAIGVTILCIGALLVLKALASSQPSQLPIGIIVLGCIVLGAGLRSQALRH